MRLILTLIYAALLIATAVPAGASVHAAMYCWVPDFEIAVACDDDDEGSDGDDSLRRHGPVDRVLPSAIVIER